MTRRLWFMLPLAALIALSALMFACGDDDDDTSAGDAEATATPALSEEQQAAADYMDSLADKFNTDIEAFLDEFTEPGLRALLQDEETPIEDLKTQAVESVSGETVEFVQYDSIDATADGATVSLVSTLGRTINAEEFVLSKDGDDFQVTGYTDLPEELPTGGSVLDVTGIDFGYDFEGGDAEGGVEAISFTNGGEQFHQIVLLKTAVDAPELDTIVEEALAAEGPDDLPASVEEVVGETSAPPGGSGGMVFTDSLEAARYVMICFIPDETQGEEGPPHATLGMAAEFTVQ